MPLEYGDSAVTNEMCILLGIVYPVPDAAQALVQCEM